MWNSFRTDAPPAVTAEGITLTGANGDTIHAYAAKPAGLGPHPGVVLIHHMPGWSEFYLETTRRMAHHGYNAICTDLYCRAGHGLPDDVTAKVRADGGVADDDVVGDSEAAMKWLKALPTSNGKVGIFGTCSGGRHSLLVASRVKGFAAVGDLWGGGVIATADQLTPKRPVPVIDYTKDLTTPLIGIFGNDDQSPPPDQVNQHEAELKKHGKEYEFHRYDGAGHGFIYYHRTNYRPEQAMDAWEKLFAFFKKHVG